VGEVFPIPEEAIEAALTASSAALDRGEDAARAALRAAAPLIVASLMEEFVADLLALSADGGEIDELTRKWQTRLATLRPDKWCNCQAIPGSVIYPGPWHPKGDSFACLSGGRASVLRGEGQRDA